MPDDETKKKTSRSRLSNGDRILALENTVGDLREIVTAQGQLITLLQSQGEVVPREHQPDLKSDALNSRLADIGVTTGESIELTASLMKAVTDRQDPELNAELADGFVKLTEHLEAIQEMALQVESETQDTEGTNA